MALIDKLVSKAILNQKYGRTGIRRKVNFARISVPIPLEPVANLNTICPMCRKRFHQLGLCPYCQEAILHWYPWQPVPVAPRFNRYVS